MTTDPDQIPREEYDLLSDDKKKKARKNVEYLLEQCDKWGFHSKRHELVSFLRKTKQLEDLKDKQ